MRNGRALLRMRMNWYCSRDIAEDWALGDTGWRVQLEGDTPLDVTLRFPVPLEAFTATMPGYTAHRAVNAVAVVCAAGLREIKSRLLIEPAFLWLRRAQILRTLTT
jgi:4-hydroxy-tetrahydrodipicolinate reductase